MKPRIFHFAVTALLACLLAGCGVNYLRVQSANEVSLTAKAVVSQSNAALDLAKDRRARALTSLIASDPSCSPTNELYIFVPIGPPRPDASRPSLCAKTHNDSLAGYRAVPINFTPIGPEEIKPTLLLAAAVAEYGDAMGKIAGKPDPDIAKILASAAEKATEAKILAEALTNSKLPALPDLASKQAQTATKLVQFLVSLAHEAQKVKDIRALFAKRGPETMEILESLRQQVNDWNSATSASYTQINESNLVRAYELEREKMNFEGRRAFVELINQSRQDSINVKKTNTAFLEAVKKLEEAHETLDNLLNGRLTPEQEKEAAEISQKRILTALKLIADATIAWGGL